MLLNSDSSLKGHMHVRCQGIMKVWKQWKCIVKTCTIVNCKIIVGVHCEDICKRSLQRQWKFIVKIFVKVQYIEAMKGHCQDIGEM